MSSLGRLLLVLQIASIAALGAPKSHLGGGPLGAIPHDGKALAYSFGVLGGFDKVVQYLAAQRVLSRPAARKVMHCGAGPLFLCCWPWFSAAPSARYWASVGPMALTLKAFLAGAGIVDDPKTVASMSRSGDRRELLRGPTLYGTVFVAATVSCWRSLAGIIALVALCAGDGFAEIVGRSPLGRRGPRLPWCPRKSLAGSLAFFAATLCSATAFALKFAHLGWWAPLPTRALVAGVAKVAAAAALAESLETGPWDNPIIFAVAAAAARVALPPGHSP